jgi:dTDP-4-dehydrorhamnose 3,5-epimerase
LKQQGPGIFSCESGRAGDGGPLKTEKLAIEGLYLITPASFADERGFFSEFFNQRNFEAAIGEPAAFVQDNFSRSAKNVLRGLHYQLPPQAQGKLVRCVRGAIFDVAVDLRKGSPTLGKWIGLELSESNRQALWIPAGFAHGFLALDEVNDVLYKTTAYYSKEHERAIRWDDQDLGIEWPRQASLTISAKDADAGPYAAADYFG